MMLNSLIGMRSYLHIRHIMSNAIEEMNKLDSYPD